MSNKSINLMSLVCSPAFISNLIREKARTITLLAHNVFQWFVPTVYAVVLVVGLAFMTHYTVKMLLSNEFYELTHRYPLSFLDFMRFYSIGQIVLSDYRTQVYDPVIQLDFFNRLITPAHTDTLMFVQHPPFVMSCFLLLAVLPLNIAYAGWFLFSLLCGSSALLFGLKVAGKINTLQILFFLIATAASLPAWRAHYLGQLSWFVLAFVMLYFAALTKNRDILAGIALALSTVKLQYLPFWILPVLALKKGKLALSFLVSIALLSMLAGVIIGWQNVANYPYILMHVETSNDAGLFPQLMISSRGLLSTCMPSAFAVPLAMLLAAPVLAILFVLWRNLHKTNSESASWLIAITVLAGLLFSPHVHHYDCLLLAIPAAFTFTTINPMSAIRIKSPYFRWWMLLLIVYPVISWFFAYFGIFTVFNTLLLVLAIMYYKCSMSR